MSDTIYIGWDVGAWHCDSSKTTAKSNDAFAVILPRDMSGTPSTSRGNFSINLLQCGDSKKLIDAIFYFCGIKEPPLSKVILAIDAPLGFPKIFRELLLQYEPCKPFGSAELKTMKGQSRHNTFLYRETERQLFERGFEPKSAVGDRLGSHATKAMYALHACKLQLNKKLKGSWKDNEGHLTVIEVYPTVLRTSDEVSKKVDSYISAGLSRDEEDALYCACAAELFDKSPDLFKPPPNDVDDAEGWIWAPDDARQSNKSSG